LIPYLLDRGHEVTVFDCLMFGGDQLIPFFRSPNFHFVLGDIRDREFLAKHMEGKDCIIHLAAIVGYPACRKDPSLAQTVNVDGTKNVVANLASNQFAIYASTGSNYGSVDSICTEETPLNPLSLYGVTKTIAEQMMLDTKQAVVFRFATAFGISPRLRLDLLINDFTYKCVSQGYLVVYEREFKRTFIHVTDMAEAICMAIDKKEQMLGHAYNVGSDSMNKTKKEICDMIAARTGAYVHYADVGEDADKRNYEVSYSKISALGYQTQKSIEEGIDELVRVSKAINLNSHYFNA
jgi:nucleoside-diphosphate-sugar epimerase